MIELSTILTLLLLHFFADFIAQDDRMATEKSSDDTWLIFHVSVYILPFFMFGWLFALVNWVAHFATDYVSSRVAKRLWEAKERHWFFVVIGFDQFIHLATLFSTYVWLVQ